MLFMHIKKYSNRKRNRNKMCRMAEIKILNKTTFTCLNEQVMLFL